MFSKKLRVRKKFRTCFAMSCHKLYFPKHINVGHHIISNVLMFEEVMYLPTLHLTCVMSKTNAITMRSEGPHNRGEEWRVMVPTFW